MDEVWKKVAIVEWGKHIDWLCIRKSEVGTCRRHCKNRRKMNGEKTVSCTACWWTTNTPRHRRTAVMKAVFYLEALGVEEIQ